MYGLLDLVVDEYFVAIDGFDEYYDEISQALFDEQPLEPNQQRSWFAMRRSLVRFHRLVAALREAVGALIRHEQHTPDELRPYFQDVCDHVLRISESSDSLRELGAAITETNFALLDFRQNQIVKKVTSWEAIIAIPTLITGYYGMNVPYLGSGDTAGVVVSAVLAVGCPPGCTCTSDSEIGCDHAPSETPEDVLFDPTLIGTIYGMTSPTCPNSTGSPDTRLRPGSWPSPERRSTSGSNGATGSDLGTAL